MRLNKNFKNPEDLTESDELDEFSEEDEIAGLLIPAALQRELLENDGMITDEESNLSDRDPTSISDASDWESDDVTHSDDSFVDSDEDSDANASDDPKDSNSGNKGLSSAEEVPNKKPKISDTSNDNEDGAGCSHLNEDEEDDETIRAIIAAIKKTKDTPPEIKLEDLVTDICFHPGRDIIALATVNGDVCLYSYSTTENKLLRTIEVHAKACRDVEFTDDGCSLLTCSKDKSIMVTDMETEKLKKFYESAHDDAINKLYVLDQNLFATGDDGGTVKLWDLRQKNEIFSLKEVDDYISQMLSNDSKKLLLVTSGDGYLTTFNIGARKRYVQSEPYEDELTCMGIYRGDSKLVVGSSKGRFYTYNWGQFGYHCDVFPGLKTPLTTMVPITDRIGIVAGDEGVIRACHIAPFRNLGIVGQHSMPVENLDVCNNGEFIASSSHNNDVRFWNVKYFEDFGNIKYNEKHNQYKEKHHNLPSSKFSNATDFFADLAKAADDDVED